MGVQKVKTVMDETDDPGVYAKARKYYLEGEREINCTFCPYHEKENLTHNPQKSWKKKRKTKYKI